MLKNYSKSFEYSYSVGICWLCDNLHFVSCRLDIRISRTFLLLSNGLKVISKSRKRLLQVTAVGTKFVIMAVPPEDAQVPDTPDTLAQALSSCSSSSSSGSSWGEFTFFSDMQTTQALTDEKSLGLTWKACRRHLLGSSTTSLQDLLYDWYFSMF